MLTVGFIGIGTMGRDMALNLIAAGHRVQVHDVVAAAAQSLADHGATVAGSIADAAAGADLVVTMLPDTPQVEEVLLGPGGLGEHPPAGGVVVDMSTISPEATRRMHAALARVGVSLLDGPVSGGPIGAKNGTLSIMIGGDQAAFEKARPALEAMGKTIVHVGPTGAGQTAKLCNQIMVGLNLQAVCEALALGRAAGVDLEVLRQVMLGGSAASWMLDKMGPAMIAKDDKAGFRIDLMLKDLRLVGELAFSVGLPLPGTALVTSQYLDARAHGEGGLGNQALFRVYDRMSNQGE